MDYHRTTRHQTTSALRRSFGLKLGILAVALGLILLGIKGWRIYELAQTLRADVYALEAIAQSKTGSASLDTLTPLLGKTRADSLALREEVGPLFPLTRSLGWLPVYGADIAAADHMLDGFVNVVAAFDDTSAALVPLARELDRTHPFSDTLSSQRFVEQLALARPRLEQAHQSISQASASWDKISVDTLPPSLQARARKVELLLPLMDSGVNLALATDDAATALRPLLSNRNTADPPGVALLTTMLSARPQLERLRQSLDEFSVAWDAIPADMLPSSWQSQAQRISILLPQARNALDLALALPDLLGAQGPRNYLVIAQNPDELRPTGGFFSAASMVTVDHGRLENLSMRDASHVDSQRLYSGPYLDPPEPLLRYMNIQQWAFRDSNWSPDFPTSARYARFIYTLSQQTDIAGVIAFDPTTLNLLLKALGPLSVEGWSEPVSAENITSSMREQYNVGLRQRKGTDAVVGPLSEAVFHRLETDASELDLPALARAFKRALDERHLLVAVEDPAQAALFARLGWDGAVRPDSADFLMVVDSNLGYNKANISIQQAISYTVDLSDPGAPLATATIRYTHRAHEPKPCVHYGTRYMSYEAMIPQCYWDYLRVLAPGSSQFITATSYPTPAEWLITGVADDGATSVYTGTANTTTFNTFLVVPTAERRDIALRYRLPPGVLTQDGQGWHYHLKLQKQAGREAIPVHVEVRLPRGAALLSSSPPPDRRDARVLSFTLSLDQDKTLDIRF